MANPVFVDCPEGAWTKVATDVTSGVIHKVTEAPAEYLQTYKMTGVAAPTLVGEGVMIFENSRSEVISATAGIDIYIWAVDQAGRVRADL